MKLMLELTVLIIPIGLKYEYPHNTDVMLPMHVSVQIRPSLCTVS